LCTSKKSLEDTKAYCDFILRNIKKKELFAWIDMEPHRYWQNLLFMDNANFGGIKCDADSGTEMIIAHWNIADFLPSATKQIFDLIISDFILHLRNSPKVKAEVDKENSDPNPQRDAAPALINTYLTQRLFQIIENIQHSLDGEQHALAFIKTVCAVLSLDKSIETEVFRLKKVTLSH
jgi:DNA polymerase epsilon subunit 1